MINSDVTEGDITRGTIAEDYGGDKLERDKFPLTYWKIDKYKLKIKLLIAKVKRANAIINLIVEAKK